MDTNSVPSKRPLVVGVVGALLLVGVLFSVNLVKQSRENRTQAASRNVRLALTVSPKSVSNGGNVSVTLLITAPKDKSITGVSTELLYSTDSLTAISANAGTFFTSTEPANAEMLSVIDTTKPGVVTLALGAPCTKTEPYTCTPAKGSGIVATITFVAKGAQPSSATVSFDQAKTVVTTTAQSGNAVATDKLASATITIGDSVAATATPTPLVTSGVSPTLTQLSAFGYWPLDEGSGSTVADASGHSFNATAVGTTIEAGKYGSARRFNGVSDTISVPSLSGTAGTSIKTISAWVNPSSVPTDQRFLVGIAWGTQLIINNQGHIAFTVRLSDNWYSVSDPSPVVPNQWTHYTGVIATSSSTGTTLKLYKNGVLVGEQSFNMAIASYRTCTLWFGGVNETSQGCAYTGQFYAGMLDDIRVFNQPLSATQVTSLYNQIPL